MILFEVQLHQYRTHLAREVTGQIMPWPINHADTYESYSCTAALIRGFGGISCTVIDRTPSSF